MVSLQVEIYEDVDNARKDDIAALRGEDAFQNFYQRYNETVEYHRRFSTNDLTGPDDDADESLRPTEPDIPFSGEEAYGRFLDLIELHQMWQNAPFGKVVDYMTYVKELPHHMGGVPLVSKRVPEYERYVTELYQYLESFYFRTQPLSLWDKKKAAVEAEFNSLWESGQVPGWQTKELNDGGDEHRNGDGNLHAEGHGLSQSHQGRGVDENENTRHQEIALVEFKVRKLCEILEPVIKATVERIEKRQAQTWAEIEAEKEEEAEENAPLEEEDLEDDEDDYVYNPLKLPLGWDGKPIPFWLYKLHGLNKEFKCEICGGASYWGRRAFEKHFKEAKHQAGMKALGIPNTKQFYEVTSIADALALWKSMQERQKGAEFKPEEDEEYEDEEGNVYSKKVYMDLKRQGIL